MIMISYAFIANVLLLVLYTIVVRAISMKQAFEMVGVKFVCRADEQKQQWVLDFYIDEQIDQTIELNAPAPPSMLRRIWCLLKTGIWMEIDY